MATGKFKSFQRSARQIDVTKKINALITLLETLGLTATN